MNSSGLASSSLSGNALGRIDALRTLAGVPSGVGTVSQVDENSQMSSQDQPHNQVSHQNHGAHHITHHLPQQLHHHNVHTFPVQDSFGKLNDTVAKLENEVNTLGQDVAYLRHVVDFQGLKIAKLVLLITEMLHNKDVTSLVNLAQAIQDSDPFDVDETHDSVDLISESVHDLVHEVSSLPSLQSLGVVPGVVNVLGVLLDSNMDPQLHQVAQAAVQAQLKDLNDKKGRKRPFGKINGNSKQQHQQQPQSQAQTQHHSQQHPQHPQQHPQQLLQHSQQLSQLAQNKDPMSNLPGLEVVSVDAMTGRKKPKISIDFLHNPMTVKEIYDEFTKGFRGQPPLRQMDERFGKHEWRGDSRSKESKRFQRRKKLCDAIERGMAKYAKSAEEIISYIEEFRGDKSLTWVMNGNLPRDLTD